MRGPTLCLCEPGGRGHPPVRQGPLPPAGASRQAPSAAAGLPIRQRNRRPSAARRRWLASACRHDLVGV